MAIQSKKPAGFPTNNIKGQDWYYNPGCGGKGGGGCPVVASHSYIYWPVKVNPFSRFNRRLVLQNESFRPYTNAGPNGSCAASEGVPTEYDVYLYYEAPTGVLDYSKAVSKITIPAATAVPFELEFNGATDASNKLPQPTHPDYERRIWVVLDFRAAGLLLNGYPQQYEVFKTTALDWEGTP